jgi:type VI secretion system protein ImpK
MPLSDCFVEIMAYTTFVVRGGSGQAQNYEQVRSNFQRLITQGEAGFQKAGYSQEDFNLARFAVFAWIDETILSSAWEGRQQWLREQLQRQYYQTADAGELFFERLNVIGPHQRDVREVYYLCLSLGFVGQYCNPGDDVLLDQLKTSNLKLLTGSSMGVPSLEKQELFPEAYPVQTEDVTPGRTPQRWSPFILISAAAPVTLFGVLFLVYRFILHNIGQNLIGTVP